MGLVEVQEPLAERAALMARLLEQEPVLALPLRLQAPRHLQRPPSLRRRPGPLRRQALAATARAR